MTEDIFQASPRCPDCGAAVTVTYGSGNEVPSGGYKAALIHASQASAVFSLQCENCSWGAVRTVTMRDSARGKNR